MKITSFNPLIVSKQAEEIVALFEELGFKKRHAPTMDDQTAADQDFRMKDDNGFALDVAQHPLVPQDLTFIRMNVRDFDEAYASAFYDEIGMDEQSYVRLVESCLPANEIHMTDEQIVAALPRWENNGSVKNTRCDVSVEDIHQILGTMFA